MQKKPFYRNWVDTDLFGFSVTVDETDLYILAKKDLKKETLELINRFRKDIIDYIKLHPEFEKSLKPISVTPDAPLIVSAMQEASKKAGVGPMATVAGAISGFVGKELLKYSDEVILENGGDIFIKTNKVRNIAIYAGSSPLSGKLSLRIKPEDTPLGICTSSGTVGHSLNFGNADAVCVVADDALLSDACATGACNIVKKETDIEKALNFAKKIEGVKGAVVIYRSKVGIKGDIELI